jgi:restriction system protein
MTATATKPMTMKDAAAKVLEEAGGPLRPAEITERALKGKLIHTEGATPTATMAAQLSVDIKGDETRFVRTKPGIYGLKGRDRKGQNPVD